MNSKNSFRCMQPITLSYLLFWSLKDLFYFVGLIFLIVSVILFLKKYNRKKMIIFFILACTFLFSALIMSYVKDYKEKKELKIFKENQQKCLENHKDKEWMCFPNC